MPTTRPTCRLTLLAALFVGAPALRADEVQWRSDYNRARQEAAESGRPLIIDFGTVACHWCRQLDATTFREPAIVALLNERCVPLKVDASRNPALAEALRIQSYPTLVYAAPDGRILGFQEGYVEGARFQDQLSRVLAAVSAPDWMQRDFQDAVKARGNGDVGRAVSLLRNVVRTARNGRCRARRGSYCRRSSSRRRTGWPRPAS